MQRLKRTFTRRLALLMSVVLLLSQGSFPVLAKEDEITVGMEYAGDIEGGKENKASLCSCEIKCNVDNINETCTVCAQDYEQ